MISNPMRGFLSAFVGGLFPSATEGNNVPPDWNNLKTQSCQSSSYSECIQTFRVSSDIWVKNLSLPFLSFPSSKSFSAQVFKGPVIPYNSRSWTTSVGSFYYYNSGTDLYNVTLGIRSYAPFLLRANTDYYMTLGTYNYYISLITSSTSTSLNGGKYLGNVTVGSSMVPDTQFVFTFFTLNSGGMQLALCVCPSSLRYRFVPSLSP